jgi:hypothetical protein
MTIMKKFIEIEVTGGTKLFNTDFIYKIEVVDEARSRIFLNVPGKNEFQLQDYIVHSSYTDLIKLFEVGRIGGGTPNVRIV